MESKLQPLNRDLGSQYYSTAQSASVSTTFTTSTNSSHAPDLPLPNNPMPTSSVHPYSLPHNYQVQQHIDHYFNHHQIWKKIHDLSQHMLQLSQRVLSDETLLAQSAPAETYSAWSCATQILEQLKKQAPSHTLNPPFFLSEMKPELTTPLNNFDFKPLPNPVNTHPPVNSNMNNFRTLYSSPTLYDNSPFSTTSLIHPPSTPPDSPYLAHRSPNTPDDGRKTHIPYTKLIKRNRRNRKGKTAPKDDDRCCAWCGSGTTPEWRNGPDGSTLCNACGLQYRNFMRQEKEEKEKNAIQKLLN